MADAQSLLTGYVLNSDAKAKLVKGVAAKITNLDVMDVAAAHQLVGAISASGLTSELKQTLEDSINERLMKAAPSTNDGLKQQLLTFPSEFLTAKDWLKLEDPSATPSGMLRVIGQRYSLSGIRSFDEKQSAGLLRLCCT